MGRVGGWLASLLVSAVAATATAQSDPGPGAAPAGPVELQDLLKLPSSLDYSVEMRGGRTPGEWRARFRGIRESLAGERAALSEAETRLEDVAAGTDPWTVGPALPGVASTDAPLDFQLRQELRRHRDEIERLERQLRELEIEANLAGVPEEWRR